MTATCYIITKTDAGHGGGPIETLGVFICSYEQAEAVVENDRREERAERSQRFEAASGRLSMGREDYLAMYEKSYSITRHQLQDLGGRDEE